MLSGRVGSRDGGTHCLPALGVTSIGLSLGLAWCKDHRNAFSSGLIPRVDVVVFFEQLQSPVEKGRTGHAGCLVTQTCSPHKGGSHHVRDRSGLGTPFRSWTQGLTCIFLHLCPGGKSFHGLTHNPGCCGPCHLQTWGLRGAPEQLTDGQEEAGSFRWWAPWVLIVFHLSGTSHGLLLPESSCISKMNLYYLFKPNLPQDPSRTHPSSQG